MDRLEHQPGRAIRTGPVLDDANRVLACPGAHGEGVFGDGSADVEPLTGAERRIGTPHPLEGVSISGRVGVIYSQDGLNDTAHAPGCCCCGGNEITNCLQVNVNILAYALIY